VISARDSSTLHPGTVDVVVYPPLALEDWTLDNLSDRIAEVRQLYIDTLKNWPVGSVPKADLYDRPTSPPKKAPAKKAPAKKVPAKKVPAKKAAGQTAAAKKTAPQKNPETRVRGRR
jgi:putative phosphoserine phosphatase/1-acylglycerol-3-phosphate O-acyltransferase